MMSIYLTFNCISVCCHKFTSSADTIKQTQQINNSTEVQVVDTCIRMSRMLRYVFSLSSTLVMTHFLICSFSSSGHSGRAVSI